LKENKKDVNDEKDSSVKIRELSTPMAVLRIILGFFGLLIWIVIGVYPTIILSSGIQQFIGVFSFFTKNPSLFLLIAFINILFGVIEYIFIGIFWWTAFHIVWSIRWFYGYRKYSKIEKTL
jgi:hypothetical protein